MTLLNDRLKEAGVKTAESRLAVLALESLRESNQRVVIAMEILWKKLSNEPWVAKEALLLPYLRERHRDMRGSAQPEPEKTSEPTKSVIKPRQTPSPERKVAVDKLVKKALNVIQFKYKTSDGRDWARVGAHELDGMDRDGELARAVKSELGTLTNKQRFLDLGELMTPKSFNEIRARVRKS